MELLISTTGLPEQTLNLSQTLTRPLESLLTLEGTPDNVEVSVLICNDRTICELNFKHRGRNSPTDVLSFPQMDGDLNNLKDANYPIPLGDIVISLDTALRQAAEAGWPLQNELSLLAIHGLLHLLGYDDETLSGAILMQQKTAVALRNSGLNLPKDPEAHPFFRELAADS